MENTVCANWGLEKLHRSIHHWLRREPSKFDQAWICHDWKKVIMKERNSLANWGIWVSYFLFLSSAGVEIWRFAYFGGYSLLKGFYWFDFLRTIWDLNKQTKEKALLKWCSLNKSEIGRFLGWEIDCRVFTNFRVGIFERNSCWIWWNLGLEGCWNNDGDYSIWGPYHVGH